MSPSQRVNICLFYFVDAPPCILNYLLHPTYFYTSQDRMSGEHRLFVFIYNVIGHFDILRLSSSYIILLFSFLLKGHWRFPNRKEIQGYAYTLTHPGTPAVFYDHIFSHYRSEIAGLISLRNRNKINCRSRVSINDNIIGFIC